MRYNQVREGTVTKWYEREREEEEVKGGRGGGEWVEGGREEVETIATTTTNIQCNWLWYRVIIQRDFDGKRLIQSIYWEGKRGRGKGRGRSMASFALCWSVSPWLHWLLSLSPSLSPPLSFLLPIDYDTIQRAKNREEDDETILELTTMIREDCTMNYRVRSNEIRSRIVIKTRKSH